MDFGLSAGLEGPPRRRWGLPARLQFTMYLQRVGGRPPTKSATTIIEGPDLANMSTKRNTAADLQRELLEVAVRNHNSRLRFARSSAETLETTYAALLSLQRKKLIEPEKVSDPAVMSWKITKAGRAAVAVKSGRR
jgi:hypothetical protein